MPAAWNSRARFVHRRSGWSHNGSLAQDGQRVLPTHGMRVALGFKAQRLRDHQLCEAPFAEAKDGHDRLSLHGHARLRLVVEWPLNGAHVEEDPHGIVLPSSVWSAQLAPVRLRPNARAHERAAFSRASRAARLFGSGVDVGRIGMRRRRRQPFRTHAFKMEGDRLSHLTFDVVACGPSCDAAVEIWRVRRETGRGVLHNDEIFHCFNPACLRMLLNVPGPRSSLGFPGTVTSPTFEACLYCR